MDINKQEFPFCEQCTTCVLGVVDSFCVREPLHRQKSESFSLNRSREGRKSHLATVLTIWF